MKDKQEYDKKSERACHVTLTYLSKISSLSDFDMLLVWAFVENIQSSDTTGVA